MKTKLNHSSKNPNNTQTNAPKIIDEIMPIPTHLKNGSSMIINETNQAQSNLGIINIED